MGRLTKLEGASREAINAAKTRMLETSTEYDRAYENYARVIQAAKLEAQNQQAYADVVMGIAIAVIVGVTIEAVPIMLGVTAAAEAAGVGLKAAGKAALRPRRARPPPRAPRSSWARAPRRWAWPSPAPISSRAACGRRS